MIKKKRTSVLYKERISEVSLALLLCFIKLYCEKNLQDERNGKQKKNLSVL